MAGHFLVDVAFKSGPWCGKPVQLHEATNAVYCDKGRYEREGGQWFWVPSTDQLPPIKIKA